MITAHCNKHGNWNPEVNIICNECFLERSPRTLTVEDYRENDRLTKTKDYAYRYEKVASKPTKTHNKKILLLS